MKKGKLHFTLNGTPVNPFHRMGLKMNPYPQSGKMELYAADMALNSLGADQLKGTDDIRERLRGKFNDAFIEHVCSQFVPGKMVKCVYEWGSK